MKNQKKAYIYAVASVVIWSTVGSAFKVSLKELDFLQLLFHSSLISIVAIFTTMIWQGKLGELKKVSKQDCLKSATMGFLNPFLYYVILFKAYSLLPAQEAQPLNYTWPIMLVLLSVPLLGQKIDMKGIVSILVSFFGVLIISTKGDIGAMKFSSGIGAMMALLTAVIWAFFWIINLKDEREETSKLLLNFCFGFFYIAVATMVYSEIKIPTISGFLGASYVGLFEMGITFILWSKALRLTESTEKISNLVYLVPFLSLIVIYFVVGEKVLPSSVVGLLFIIAGVLIQKQKRRLCTSLTRCSRCGQKGPRMFCTQPEPEPIEIFPENCINIRVTSQA